MTLCTCWVALPVCYNHVEPLREQLLRSPSTSRWAWRGDWCVPMWRRWGCRERREPLPGTLTARRPPASSRPPGPIVSPSEPLTAADAEDKPEVTDIDAFMADFELADYEPHKKIAMDMAV